MDVCGHLVAALEQIDDGEARAKMEELIDSLGCQTDGGVTTQDSGGGPNHDPDED